MCSSDLPSLEELHHRLEQSPTPANWLELGQRLVEREEYAEALPHLQAALEREPDHCWSLFLLALAHRGLGHPEQAVSPLEKLVARHAGWKDYKAWHLLIAVCEESGDQAGTGCDTVGNLSGSRRAWRTNVCWQCIWRRSAKKLRRTGSWNRLWPTI